MNEFKRNTKGFTLIELLVAMVIFVFVLAISSAVFVFSTDMYRSNVIDQNDQRILETISSYVQEELQFAGAISSQDEYATQSGWHTISIDEDGYLRVDNQRVVTSSLYGRRKLKVTFTINDTDKSRIDAEYVLYGESDDATLKSSIFLTNIELNISNGALIGTEKVETIMGVKSNSLTISDSNNVANQSHLYFYNGKSVVNVPDIDEPVKPSTGTGTIADIVTCVYENPKYQAAITEWKANIFYIRGQVISYLGNVYRVFESHTSMASILPGGGASTYPFYQDISNSGWQNGKVYFEGDVIIHKDVYYVRTNNEPNLHAVEPGPADSWNVWKKLDKAPETNCADYTNVLDEESFIGEWTEDLSYKVGDVVYYNGNYYKAKKDDDHGSGKPPGEDSSTWNLLNNPPIYKVENEKDPSSSSGYRPEGEWDK